MDWSLLGFSGLRELLNIHPAFVHFPVALFPASLFGYAAGLLWKKDALLLAGSLCLWLAFASVVPTAWTGFVAAGSFPHGGEVGEMIETHEQIGIALSLVSAGLVVWSFVRVRGRPKMVGIFMVALAFAAYLALQNGDIGSRMVYVHGAGVEPVVASEVPGQAPAKETGESE